MACDWRSRESGAVRWQYTKGDMEASTKMAMRRPLIVHIWRKFLDEPTWWAMREELD